MVLREVCVTRHWLWLGLIGAALASGCATTPGTSTPLAEARARYAEIQADEAVFRANDSGRHLEKAAAALRKAEESERQWGAFGVESARPEIDHQARIALREVEMAQLAARNQAALLQVAQLKQQREALMVARSEPPAEPAKPTAQDDLERALARAEARGAEVKRGLEQVEVTFRDFTFDFDRAEVRPQFSQPLIDLAAALKRFDQAQLIVEGYTDNVGAPGYNAKLSEQRALAVKTFLINQGVPADRIVSRGRGEEKPVASNDSEAGREKNRRVELVINNPLPVEGAAGQAD